MPQDKADIRAICLGRPEMENPHWQVHPGAQIAVHRDELGVSAFLIFRHEVASKRIFADQLEGVRHNGQPTFRGMRGMLALGEFLEARAKELGVESIFTAVDLKNQRHIKALRRLGWSEEITVMVKAVK